MDPKKPVFSAGNEALFLVARLLGQTNISDVELDIPEELADIEDQEQSTDAMLIRLKENHMEQQNELVKDIKLMAEESRKIIDEISGVEAELDKYQGQIDVWIKTIGDMESFVSKVKGVREPFEKRCKNLSKLKDYLSGDKAKRR